MTDYYHQTADEIMVYTETHGPPASDNILINGTNKNPTTGDGEYATITLTPGKRHRLRLINTSVENNMQISIVNHTMTVIETDFVPVNSYTTDSLFVGIGQRYDVTIDASQAVDNYWFNVTFGGSNFCGSSNNPYPAAILRYDGAPTENPTDPGTTPVDHQCLDFFNFTPVVTRQVPTSGFAATTNNSLDFVLTSNANKWTVSGSTLDVDWNNPIAQFIANGEDDWAASNNIWKTDLEDQVRYIYPISLLGQGLTWNFSLTTTLFVNSGRTGSSLTTLRAPLVFLTLSTFTGMTSLSSAARPTTQSPAKSSTNSLPRMFPVWSEATLSDEM